MATGEPGHNPHAFTAHERAQGRAYGHGRDGRPNKPRKAKGAKQLDSEIVRLYTQFSQGKCINMMDIPKLHDEVRRLVLSGQCVAEAVQRCIAKYGTEA